MRLRFAPLSVVALASLDTVVCVNHHALRWQSRGSEKGAVAKGELLLSDK
jgi:hypothetical protein